jgi:hypothetical protein
MKVRFGIQQKHNSDLWQIFLFVSDKAFKPEVKYFTGRMIKPLEWNKKSYRGKGGIHGDLNSRLSSLDGIAKSIFSDLEKEKKLGRVEFINRLLIADGKEDRVKKNTSDKTFWEHWKEYEELSKTRVSKITKRTLSQGTLTRVAQAGRNLKKFEDKFNYKLTPFNLTSTFYENLRRFYIGDGENDLGNTVNSFSDLAKHVKHFAKWLHKRFPDSPRDFEDFERYEDYDEENIQPLQPDEVMKLWNLDLDKIKGYEDSYYIFMNQLSYGLRISDHNFFQFSDLKDFKRVIFGHQIEGKILSFKNVKSRSSCNVPLVDNEIFRPEFMYNKLKGLGYIPRIEGDTLNRHLEKIAAAAEIDRIRLMSKTARKTFATLWLLLGMEIYEVMKMGGWKSEKAFRAYVGIDRSDLFLKTSYIKESQDRAAYLRVS